MSTIDKVQRIVRESGGDAVATYKTPTDFNVAAQLDGEMWHIGTYLTVAVALRSVVDDVKAVIALPPVLRRRPQWFISESAFSKRTSQEIELIRALNRHAHNFESAIRSAKPFDAFALSEARRKAMGALLDYYRSIGLLGAA